MSTDELPPQEIVHQLRLLAVSQKLTDEGAQLLYAASDALAACAAVVEASCAECGRKSTPDGMWALYCLDCIEKMPHPSTEQLNAAFERVQPVLAAMSNSSERACADLEAEVQRLNGRLLLQRENAGTAKLLHDELNKVIAQRDERIAYLERTHVEPEGWAAFEAALKIAQERAEVAEARVKELEELANKALKEFQTLRTERDALRAQIEAIQVTMDKLEHSGGQGSSDLKEWLELKKSVGGKK